MPTSADRQAHVSCSKTLTPNCNFKLSTFPLHFEKMDFSQDFLHQQVTHLSSSLNLISRELVIIQDFLKLSFASKWPSYYENRKQNLPSGGARTPAPAASSRAQSNGPLSRRGNGVQDADSGGGAESSPKRRSRRKRGKPKKDNERFEEISKESDPSDSELDEFIIKGESADGDEGNSSDASDDDDCVNVSTDSGDDDDYEPARKRKVPASRRPPKTRQPQPHSFDFQIEVAMNEQCDNGNHNDGATLSEIHQEPPKPFEFLPSTRGKPLLVHKGYLYLKETECDETSKNNWRCMSYTRNKCIGRCVTDGNQILSEKPHNHPPDLIDLEVRKLRLKIANAASGADIREMVKNLPPELKSRFPKTSSLIRRFRERKRTAKESRDTNGKDDDVSKH